MSNCWPTRSTSVAGSRPASPIAAKTSYSLPKPQLPIVLPAKSAGDVMPLSAKLTCSVPGALEDLGDVHDVGTGFTRLQCLGHPRDREVGVAAGEFGLRDDLDARPR